MNRMKILAVAMISIVAVFAAVAAFDTYGQVTRTTIVTPTAVVATSGELITTNAAVDIAGYRGKGAFVLQVAADEKSKNTDFVATLQLQHATASNGTFANISGASCVISSTNDVTQVETVAADFNSLRRYVRAIIVATNAQGATTNDLRIAYSAILDGYK